LKRDDGLFELTGLIKLKTAFERFVLGRCDGRKHDQEKHGKKK